MTTIVGVRFHQAGKIYYFDPNGEELRAGKHVIVETARGVEMGTVLIEPKEVEDDQVVAPLKPIMRAATEEDEETVRRNKERAKEALAICKEKVAKHELDMKLVSAEYTFDNNKLLFYFTADGRIDFRELVKDLAAVFRTRIELRQIGVRDETKLLGGIGVCGRPLCCATYLSDFVPVSIRMAKEQSLSLNPTKISGMCGRLMCCLKNEQDTYEYLNSRMPSVGEIVTTSDGTRGEVHSVSVMRQMVKIVVDKGDEKELREYPVEALRVPMHKHKDVKLTEEEIRELAELEVDDSTDALDALEDAEPKARRSRRAGRNKNNDSRSRERDNKDSDSRRGESDNKNKDSGDYNKERNSRYKDPESRNNRERDGKNRDYNRRSKNRDSRSKES